MVVPNSESTHRDREDLSEFFEPVFDPGFAIDRTVAQQKRLANAAGNAVIPAGDREIDERARAIAMG